MVTERIAHAPELVQVAWQGTRGLDDHVLRVGSRLDGADDLRLAGPLQPRWREGGVDRGIPLRLLPRDAGGVLIAHDPDGQRLCERDQRLAGVSDQRQLRAVLVRVERGDVDVDELDTRMLERRARPRGEVAVARADADHDVGLGGEPVRRGRARGPDAAEILRVIPGEAAAAGLRRADGDADGLD
ncbi:hypothetical protein D3C73_1266210 [compost metagenome]